MTDTLRNFLRAETDEAHQRLHEQRSFAALVGGTIELPEYIRLLDRLHGFYKPLDHAISTALRDHRAESFDYHWRSDLLSLDLEHFGETSSKSVWSQSSSIVSPMTVGGVLYVVEGAVLGGSLMDRAACKLLGGQSTAGRCYWAWCRSEGKHRWALMLKHLDKLSSSDHSVDELVYGARATFRALGDWLTPLDRPVSNVETGIA